MYTIRPQDKKILTEIVKFAGRRKVALYLVGGYVRDIILKREKQNPDIDFCLSKGAISFGRKLADELGAGFVVLDKEHGCCRVVYRQAGKIYTFDFADFRAKDLTGDLLHRDFTINTLCVPLLEAVGQHDFETALIDLYGGCKDIKTRCIRVAHGRAFDEDPLRILRAFSLASIFGFNIEKKTLALIKAKKKLLLQVSFERIRDEVFKILGEEESYHILASLDALGILKLLIPEIEVMRGVAQGPYHHLDVWKHSLETVRQLEKVAGEYRRNTDIQNYLSEAISAERRRLALTKFSALLHDIGKPGALKRIEGKFIFHGHERVGSHITKAIAQRFKLSNNEVDALRQMVFWHLRPGYLGDSRIVSERAKFRYFRDTAREGVSILLLSLADQRATRGPLTSLASRKQHERIVSGLINEYFRKQKEEKPPKLINGDDLIRTFKLQPSPLIGKILLKVQELQALGKIKTKQEALRAAKKIKDKAK